MMKRGTTQRLRNTHMIEKYLYLQQIRSLRNRPTKLRTRYGPLTTCRLVVNRFRESFFKLVVIRDALSNTKWNGRLLLTICEIDQSS